MVKTIVMPSNNKAFKIIAKYNLHHFNILNFGNCKNTVLFYCRYKEGSKRKEILACIKLSGMNARKLCFDDKFSCFVTVDNPGHTHIMKVMSNT